MRYFFFAIMMVFLSTSANAANVWFNVQSIERLQIIQNGDFIIYFDNEVSPVCTTAGTNSVYFSLNQNGVNGDGIDALLAAALAAHLANRNVSIMYSDSTSNCFGKYLIVE